MRHDDIAGSTLAKGSVRTLRRQELPLLRDHLLRLDRSQPPRSLPWLHG